MAKIHFFLLQEPCVVISFPVFIRIYFETVTQHYFNASAVGFGQARGTDVVSSSDPESFEIHASQDGDGILDAIGQTSVELFVILNQGRKVELERGSVEHQHQGGLQFECRMPRNGPLVSGSEIIMPPELVVRSLAFRLEQLVGR
jgi:hypothetical protein